MLVAAAEMFDDAGGDEEVDTGHNGEAEGGGDHLERVGGGPGEIGEGGQGEREGSDFFVVPAEEVSEGDGGDDAEHGGGGVGEETAGEGGTDDGREGEGGDLPI